MRVWVWNNKCSQVSAECEGSSPSSLIQSLYTVIGLMIPQHDAANTKLDCWYNVLCS